MSLQNPRFRKINDSFVCENCGHKVPPAEKSCRDHCPKCLWGKHVDELPGDRNANCGGGLQPMRYELHSKKGTMIIFACVRCGVEKRNRFLDSDSFEPDSYDALLALTPQEPG